MIGSVASVVYVLCAVTCALCTALLWRSYRRSRSKLLLWIGICFAGLSASNILLPIDLIWLGSEVDLSILRSALGCGSVATLLLVLIWEAR
jgi:uncharacterized protein DUF5985